MKRIKLILFPLIFIFLSLPSDPNIKDTSNIPSKKFDIHSIRHHEFSNGMKLHLLKVDNSEKIEIFGIIRAGSVFDPTDKIGLATIAGEMLRMGGTKYINAKVIDEELDSLGTKLFIKISLINGQIRMSCNKDNFKRSLKILSEILINPSFETDRLSLAKKNLLDFMEREKKDLDSLAFTKFQKLLYGENSPYARTPTKETTNNIKQEDLFKFYNQFIHPNNISLAIWGKFDKDEIITSFEEVFGKWPKSINKNPPFPEVKVKREASVNLIVKENVNQSKIRIGHLGIMLDKDNPYNKDYIALLILDLLFGGQSFSSRLYQKIRSELGLSYDIFSMYWPSFCYPGAFVISASTRSNTTVETIQCILNELNKICEEPITDKEVNQVKEFLINSYVFQFDSPEKILARILYYEYQGLPLDYFQYIINEIPNINAQDVKGAALKYLHPELLCILVVGNEKKFDKPLSYIGKVDILSQ
ncbi:MAG: pitrilysin family protein [Acidobacteriota bacterium]